MYVVGLVLVYAVLMSVWWVCMKKLTNIKFPNNLIRFASGMGAGGLVMLSLTQHGGVSYLTTLPEQFWWSLSGTVLLNIAIAYFYLKALEKSPLSIAVHVSMLAPLLAIFTGSYVFGVDSVPGRLALIGVVVVLGGLSVIHLNPADYGYNPWGGMVEIWRKRNDWLWYALGNAVCAGFAIPLDKRCVQLSDYALAPGLTLFSAWGLAFGVAAWRAGDFAKFSSLAAHKPLRLLISLAIAFCIANGFQAMAYNYEYAAVVASLKRLDAPFTVLWSVFIFADDKVKSTLWMKIIGSLTAFAGAALIGFSRIAG